jgi:PAS domain S-box-containing protein
MLNSAWNLLLQLSDDSQLPASDLIRTSLINGISRIMLLLIACFLGLFLYFDVQNWYHLLPAFPLYITVLALQRKYFTGISRPLFFWGSFALVGAWTLLNRRSGAEYGLIALGFASAFIFEKRIILYFLAAVAAFVFYKFYDHRYVFEPVEGYNYVIFPNLILGASGLVIALEIAFYRNLSDHYYSELTNQKILLQQAIRVKQQAEAATQDANEKLKASNEELKTLTEQLDWIIKQKTSELESYLNAINVNIYSAVTDTKGLIVKINQPFMRATGYSEQELVGKNFQIIKSGHHPATFFTMLHSTILSGETWRGEIKNQDKNGNHFWIDMVILPLKNEKNELTYFLTLALPITERKELEEKREKAVEMLESVTFRTSHNIRGPLARILGLVSLIKNEMVTEEECRTVAGMLIKSSCELDQSTRDLVSFVNDHEKYFSEKLKE